MTLLSISPSDYVLSLSLPEVGPRFEAAPAPLEFSNRREAVAVGAQLAEFADTVAVELRGPIADSILLAQLAANKAAGASHDVVQWYDKYIEVLQNIGWQVHDLEFQTQTIRESNADVHKEIIPVIAAMLGPQAAAASLVVSVLKGLNEMDASTSWIALFDRASQHAHGAKFQVSYVDVGADGQPEITLMCFGIRAERTIVQVLFFKFSEQSAELKTGTGRVRISMQRLNSAKEAIANRVQAFVGEFVQNIDI